MKITLIILALSILSCSNEANTEMSAIESDSILTTSDQFSGKVVSFYKNGQLKFEENMLDGMKHGKYTIWYKNGKLKTKGVYNYGKRNGIWIWCDKNGETFYKIDYSKNFS